MDWIRIARSAISHVTRFSQVFPLLSTIHSPWLCFVPNGGFIITVSNLLTYASASRQQRSHCTKSTLEISNSSAFLLNMSSASSSMSKPTHKLQKREQASSWETARSVVNKKRVITMSHPASSIAAPMLRTPQPHPRSATSLPSMSSKVFWIV